MNTEELLKFISEDLNRLVNLKSKEIKLKSLEIRLKIRTSNPCDVVTIGERQSFDDELTSIIEGY